MHFSSPQLIWSKARRYFLYPLFSFIIYIISKAIEDRVFSWINEQLDKKAGSMIENLYGIIKWVNDNPLSYFVIVGVIYSLFVVVGTQLSTRRRAEQKDDNFIPLSEAVEKLRERGLEQTQYGYSLDSSLAMLDVDREFDRLARLFAEEVDIYGKQLSSSFNNWVKINDYIYNGIFKRRASELHL